MDFHAMKRKRLQSLCKKHGIPANLKNKEMADRLSLIFKGKENDVSCQSVSDNAGTDKGTFQSVSGKDLLNDESGELNSSSGNNDQLAASDTVAGSADVWKEKLVNSGKRSPNPNLEERIGFSRKLLKSSEIKGLESEKNLSPDITRDDVEICDVEENMESGVNKEQVDGCQEGLHSALSVHVMKDVDLVQVAMEEIDNHLEEAEVDKLGENIDVDDYVSGTGNAGDEVEKQDDTNSPQGSNVKNLSALLVSPGNYGHPLVEEVHESVDNVCVHGDDYGTVNKEQVDDSQEALLAAPSKVAMNNADCVQVDSEKFGNYLGEEKVQKLGDKHDAEELIFGTGKGGAEAEKHDTSSPQQLDVNDVNLLHISPEESGYPLVVEGEVHHGGVYSFQNSGSEVDTVCFVDTSIAAKEDDEKTNQTMEHFPDEVHSSNFKHSDIVQDLFLTTNPLSEAKSSDLNVHQLVVSGTAAGNVNACEAKIVPSSKISSDSEKIIGFSPDLLNDLETKGLEFDTNLSSETPKDDIESFDVEENMQTGDNEGLEFETNLPPATTNDDIEICAVEENMQSGINRGLEFEKNLLPATPTDDIESCDVEENMQGGVNKDHVHDSQEVLHAAHSAVVMNDVDLVKVASNEFDKHLVEREFEKLVDKTDLDEDVCGAEAEKQDDTNSPQASNINDVNREEPGYPLVEGELQTSADTICAHDSVYNFKNCETEFDLMCLLDTSITAKDSDGKSNVTAEHFPDQVHSSNFEYSDGIPDQFLATYPPAEVKPSDFNIHEMVYSDKLESSQKQGLVAYPEECIEFYSKHLEASEIKDFEVETNFDPSTPGDIVGACNMQSVKTDTVSGNEGICEEKLISSPKCTPLATSEKRNNSFPKLLESSMMKKELENERNSTLKTAREVLGTCDMKENIKTGKKEQYGSTISKKTFSKRQPLQELQQK